MARTKVKNVVSPVLYFSSRHFFPRPFRLPLTPTICPWVSEDGHEIEQGQSQDEPNRKGEIY